MSIRILIYTISLLPIFILIGISILMQDELISKLMASVALLIATIAYHHLKQRNYNNYE